MEIRLLKKVFPIYLICILISVCSGQPVNHAIFTQTLSLSITPVTVAPKSLPTFTISPTETALSGLLSTQPAIKLLNPISEIHAQINWRLKTKYLAQATSFFDLQQGWAAADTDLLQTKDGGQTWLKVSNTPDGFSRLDFVSPTHGWGVGTDWLYVTRDGGKTWEPQVQKSFTTSSGIWKPAIDFINDQVGWLADNQFRSFKDYGWRSNLAAGQCSAITKPVRRLNL
jgi:photosystem II stability/assembly factor-like uncharacterized protein